MPQHTRVAKTGRIRPKRHGIQGCIAPQKTRMCTADIRINRLHHWIAPVFPPRSQDEHEDVAEAAEQYEPPYSHAREEPARASLGDVEYYGYSIRNHVLRVRHSVIIPLVDVMADLL